MKRFLTGLLAGAVFGLCLLEAMLQFMPVASGLRMGATDGETPFSYYLPNQDFVYSFGWALDNPRRGTTNEVGFINSLSTTAPRGVLVIGDSFIESQMLSYENTLQGYLEAKLPRQVVAVAASGNNLADSLKIIEAFAPKTRSKTVVLFVEETDLSGLLSPASAGHNSFVLDADNSVTVQHSPYVESAHKNWLIKSALIRYAYYNLKLPEWIAAARRSSAATPRDVGEPRRAKVLEFFFERLKALGATYDFEAILLVDADRPSIYPGPRKNGRSSFEEERKGFLELARRHGLNVIDLAPVFARHWQDHRQRLDWLPLDGHWNHIAHGLAADEVLKRVRGREAAQGALELLNH